jgi:glycerol-3-phosphate O-acyltransferase
VEQALDEGLAPLMARGLVTADLQPVPEQAALLAFYAAAVPAV